MFHEVVESPFGHSEEGLRQPSVPVVRVWLVERQWVSCTSPLGELGGQFGSIADTQPSQT